ncbi:MAG: alternative ribosome rescue aminoacyl-tRNA hydrolase ArfB [Chloroflexota bacterium]
MIEVNQQISLHEDEIQIDFVQSSGPGGQNVNKVATKAQLRFSTHSPSLPEDVRARLQALAHNRLLEDGILLIEARRYRTQEQNRADAIARLVELIRQAAQPPKPRRKTRPSAASVEKRLETKRRRSEIKRRRQDSLD